MKNRPLGEVEGFVAFVILLAITVVLSIQTVKAQNRITTLNNELVVVSACVHNNAYKSDAMYHQCLLDYAEMEASR